MACAIAFSMGGPALHAYAEEPAPQTSQQQEEPSKPEDAEEETSKPEDMEEESSKPEEDDGESSRPATPEDDPEDEPPETPVYTVTFQMGILGSSTMEVAQGEVPGLVPEIGALPGAVILGWFNSQGEKVDPETLPITGDTVYTARWSRQVETLLNTDDHNAYISGYDNGFFLPDSPMTRAEVVSMFYKLLRQVDWEPRTFTDVQAGDWYAGAVEALAGLGAISGYEDGTFRPNNEITRAEFVAIAVAFTTLRSGDSGFSDVPEDFWGADAIYTATSLGWISGMGDNRFAPNEPITRAQAVSIINKMLRRNPYSSVKDFTDVKNFYDLSTDHWAYAAIVDASTPHTYLRDEGGREVWQTYEKDTTPVESHWLWVDDVHYYIDGNTRKIARGACTIDGVRHMFQSSGAALTGFAMDGQWRRYYQDSAPVEDISGLGVVSGPYYIKVYKPANYLIIFAKDPATGEYNTPVRSMLVSCGYGTPSGTFYTPNRFRWLRMVGDTWAQWCTQIQGNYLFHSVPNWTYDNFDLEVEEYNLLGTTRSLGCIRLNCRDAKWIYDNCALGTQVYISPTETDGPLKKPTGLKLPSWHTWDPTDPTAYYACQQRGCH